MTKRKKLGAILLGAILALGVGAGIGAGRVETGKAAPTVATMTAVENGSAAKVNNKDAIKVGTSSKGGNMKITVGTGAVKLSFYAAAWNLVTGLSINLTGATAGTTSFALTANTGIANNSPFTLSGDESSYYFETTLSGITSSTDITLTTSVAKRFVIWSASYDTEAGGGTVDPDLEEDGLVLESGPTKTVYNEGDSFDPTGVVIHAYFDDGTDEYVTNDVTYDTQTMTVGQTKVVASYTRNGVTQTVDITGLTVNAVAWATYTEITSVADLHIGATYVISGIKESAPWVMTTTQNGNNRASEAATMDTGKIKETTTIQKFELVEGTVSGSYGFKAINGDTANKYLCAASSSSNYLRSEDTLSANSSWKITFASGTPSVIAQGTYTRNDLKFNPSNNPPIFAAYASGQTDISLHVDETTVPEITFGALDHISLDTTDAKTSYFVGEEFSVDGLIVTAYDALGNNKTIATYSADKANGYEFITSDIGTVKITITGTVDGVDKTADYNVTISSARLFAKVEDMSKINTNRIYTMATELGAASTSFASWANEVNINHDGINKTFTEVTNLQAIQLEDGLSAGTFALKLLNGPNAGKYYAAVGGANELKLETTITDTSSWTISIEAGVLKISCLWGEEGNQQMRIIGHNHTSTRFAGYTSTATPAGLYTVTTLDELAVDAFVTNNMHPEIETSYLGIEEKHDECITEGYYAAAKAAFHALTADQRALFVSDDAYSAPRARLAAWAIANHEVLNTTTNMLEAPVSSTQNTMFNGLNDSNTIMLIVIISLISVSVLGGAFYLRKREQN